MSLSTPLIQGDSAIELPTSADPAEWSQTAEKTFELAGPLVVNLGLAIVIFIAGWIVSAIAALVARSLLKRTTIDNKIASWITGANEGAKSPPVEKWVGQAVFWLGLTFTLVGVLHSLELTVVSEPLQAFLNQIIGFLPKLAGAGLLLGIAWFLATVAKFLISQALQRTGLDDRFNQQVTEGGETTEPYAITDTIGNIIYWFIFLLFLPSVLSTLQLEGTLTPVQTLLDDILAVLPNIFGALLIGAIGWLIAKVVRRIVTNLLVATQADQLGAKFGISSETTGQSFSSIVGTIVYVLILIPTAISALNALQIDAISEPAIAMLNDILGAFPEILTAAIILGIAYVIGRFVAEIATTLLAGLGFNNLFSWLGLESVIPQTQAPPPTDGENSESTVLQTVQGKSPSEIAGAIVQIAILLFAAIAAVNVLGIDMLTELFAGILVGAGQILAGLIVFAVGLYLANVSFRLVSAPGSYQARMLAQTARIIIIAFAGFMALQQMGIATNIVNLAFGLLLGSIAVAIAIAFGLGGRDVAAEQLREWLSAFKNNQ